MDELNQKMMIRVIMTIAKHMSKRTVHIWLISELINICTISFEEEGEFFLNEIEFGTGKAELLIKFTNDLVLSL
jgi:hypothetical protein